MHPFWGNVARSARSVRHHCVRVSALTRQCSPILLTRLDNLPLGEPQHERRIPLFNCRSWLHGYKQESQAQEEGVSKPVFARETIAALSSGTGRAGISVIRISGPKAGGAFAIYIEGTHILWGHTCSAKIAGPMPKHLKVLLYHVALWGKILWTCF